MSDPLKAPLECWEFTCGGVRLNSSGSADAGNVAPILTTPQPWLEGHVMAEHSLSPQMDSAILDRFWSKVVRERTGCWIWTASKRNKGYGAFAYTWDGVVIHDRAHRFSYVLHCGPIHSGLFVLHHCDNPACVNPLHLFLGTNQDNVSDMMTKGRHVAACTYTRQDSDSPGNHPKGTSHHNAKLNAEIVLAIRADRVAGLSFSELARKYGIGIKHAHSIIHRKVWKHVE